MDVSIGNNKGKNMINIANEGNRREESHAKKLKEATYNKSRHDVDIRNRKKLADLEKAVDHEKVQFATLNFQQ